MNTEQSKIENELARVANRVVAIYAEERGSLRGRTAAELQEMEHQADHYRFHEDFSVRTAAEILRTAAKMQGEQTRRG